MNMYGMLFAVAGTGIILISGELLWKQNILKGEYARKFVHISTAAFAAFWPLFLTRKQIALMSVLFVVVLTIVKQLKIFKSIRGVRRSTYGEIWYALGIGATALLFKNDAIYAIAVLHMALADGFAAIVGVSLTEMKRASKFSYHGIVKTIEGTMTFLAISFLLNVYYWMRLAEHPISSVNPIYVPLYSLISASTLAVLEVISPRGSDNVIIPLAAGFLLWVPFVVLGGSTLFS